MSEQYGDATTVSTSEVLDALDEQPTGEATDHNGENPEERAKIPYGLADSPHRSVEVFA